MNSTYKYIVTLFLFFLCLSCNQKAKDNPIQLKVMSFNIWMGGGKSINATGDVFARSGADIIGIQESNRDEKNIAVQLADSLGWHSHTFDHGRTVVSKYPIIGTSPNKLGVKIQIDETHFIWMFNIHLMYCPYEPYQLNNIEYCGGPLLSTAKEAIASAIASRGEVVSDNIRDILEIQKEGYPVFLTGDFNEPSCLDWTTRATDAGLCKIPVQWPSTQAFIEKAGLKDSYRTYYTDEVKNPGHTWTPLPENSAYTEVLDRIDFVFFSGQHIELVNSQLVGEESNLSDITFPDYPSDHRAVLSTFTIQ